MVLFLEVLDLFNEYERDMQICSYSICLHGENREVIFRNEIIGNAEFGTDGSIKYWANAVGPKENHSGVVKDHFQKSIEEVNKYIDNTTKVIQWGDWKYLLGDLNTRNLYNIKFVYSGKLNLEKAKQRIHPESTLAPSVVDRMDALIEYFYTFREELRL